MKPTLDFLFHRGVVGQFYAIAEFDDDLRMVASDARVFWGNLLSHINLHEKNAPGRIASRAMQTRLGARRTLCAAAQ